MIYDVSRFGHYRLKNGLIAPGLQAQYVCATSPEEAMAKALPLLDAHKEFTAKGPAEVKEAKCRRHPRYKAKRPPADSNHCGTCHAMWRAVEKYALETSTAEGV